MCIRDSRTRRHEMRGTFLHGFDRVLQQRFKQEHRVDIIAFRSFLLAFFVLLLVSFRRREREDDCSHNSLRLRAEVSRWSTLRSAGKENLLPETDGKTNHQRANTRVTNCNTRE